MQRNKAETSVSSFRLLVSVQYIINQSINLKGKNDIKKVLRHFWGNSCVKASKFIAKQGNACPVEHVSFDSFNFIPLNKLA